MIENTEKGAKRNSDPPRVYEQIIQKLEADIRGHIRLEHEMKIHMDYLEAKVEKFEKDQKNVEDETAGLSRQIESLQDKLALLRGDRDDKDKQLKKLKMNNDELRSKLKSLEMQNDQMSLKIEQNLSSAGLKHPQPGTAVANMHGK